MSVRPTSSSDLPLLFEEPRAHEAHAALAPIAPARASRAEAELPSLCLFTDSLDPSGVGEHMLDLAHSLRTSWQVTFACPRGKNGDPFLERARKMGLQVLAIAVGKDGLPLAGPLRDWLRLSPCHVFHAHAGIGWEGHDAVRLAREAGCAVVRTEHLPYLITDEDQVREHKHLLGCIDRLICVSQAARETFLEQGCDPVQICAVRNGITPRPTPPDAAQARARLLDELGLRASTPLLLSVGRFTEQKGHAFLLRALPLLDALQKHQDTRLLWVGQGCEQKKLQAQAERAGLSERVLFLGHRDDVPSLLRACDALVLPSLFEGLPLVALEAMASGIPLVGTRVCGTEEALGGESCGWLVPPRNPEALAQALSQVLARPGDAARRAERARQRFGQYFTAERMARETDAIYREALQLRPQQKPQHRQA